MGFDSGEQTSTSEFQAVNRLQFPLVSAKQEFVSIKLSLTELDRITKAYDMKNYSRRRLALFVALFGLLVSCVIAQKRPTSVAGQASPDQPAASSKGTAKFTEVASALGIKFEYVASHTSRKYLIETMGSGVALFDYDNDGRLDIFVVNGAPLSDPTPKGTIPQKTEAKYWNRLYHQERDGTFEDVTEKAGLQGVGYGMGVAVGDYDNDGYEDLYVTAYGGNRLYHNNGDGTFTDVTEKAGVGGSGWSTSGAWVDLDGDGLLDLVVLRYLVWRAKRRLPRVLPSGRIPRDFAIGISQRWQWPLY